MMSPEVGISVEHEVSGIPATRKTYFDDMFVLKSSAIVLKVLRVGERVAVIVDNTILYPQGGGQPCDTGHITGLHNEGNFRVEEVRIKNEHVYHYGFYKSNVTSFQEGEEVWLLVDASRRLLNSRLHSAGHLLDACLGSIGLSDLEPIKGHHFPDGPFVEYKGVVPAADLETKRLALEAEANRLLSAGAKVHAVTVSYLEACNLCGGSLPNYIAKDSTPRIVTVGGLRGPCGGTHVADIADIESIKCKSLMCNCCQRPSTTSDSINFETGLISVF